MDRDAPAAPHIDGSKEEQPDHVDEVPVPGGEFEAEVMLDRQVADISADETDGEEDGAHEDMETMEAGRHEEGRPVDVAGEGEAGARVFQYLHAGEQGA